MDSPGLLQALSSNLASVEATESRTALTENLLTPALGHPAAPANVESNRWLNIFVVFTSVKATQAALARAGALADSLGARIVIFGFQRVPFPLPLDSPPVLHDWNEARFRQVAVESPAGSEVRLYLCRDAVETLMGALGPKSLVVLGGRKTRWPFTAEKRMTRALERAGHEVIFIEAE